MKIFLIGFIWLNVLQLQGHVNDSTVRKYFVCKSYSFFRPSRIIREGQKMFVKDLSGQRLRGILTILDDTLFEIHNSRKEVRDTFHIRILDNVRKPTLAYIGISSAVTILGVSTLAESLSLIGSIGLGYQVIGYIMLPAAIVEIAVGLCSFGLGRYYFEDYGFRIIETKGYKLRKRHIRKQRNIQ
jgi:hypothetical protein